METIPQRFDVKNKVYNIIENSKTTEEIIKKIYQIFVPNFDQVKEMKNHPRCGQKMWNWIYEQITEFEEKQKELFPGFVWIDRGFTVDYDLEDWEVDLSRCTLIMKNNLEQSIIKNQQEGI